MKSLGAFIITYERPQIVLHTIQRLLDQTMPPEYILVVDNSDSSNTEDLLSKFPGSSVGYHRVGYNSGPAGGAKIGLEALVERGFHWIYWGDDDNPPIDNQVFEDLLSKLENMETPEAVGIFGGKGGRLNGTSGRIDSFSNAELKENEILEVDSIPGGATLLVNAEVVKRGILPKEKLFFGFEELDFCLRIKKAGFKLLVDTEIWLRENQRNGYGDPQFKWKASYFGMPEFLWRSYYSTRNLLYIYYINGYSAAFLFLLLRSLLKSILGFGFGIGYGWKNFVLQWQAIFHFFTGRFGRLKNL